MGKLTFELKPSEINFLLANYKNYTAKQLTVSLNKIRQRTGEKILLARYVNEFISRLTGGEIVTTAAFVKEHSVKAPPLGSGNYPRQSPDDRKTKALKDYQSENGGDEMSAPLEALLPSEETAEESEKETSPDAAPGEVREKDS